MERDWCEEVMRELQRVEFCFVGIAACPASARFSSLKDTNTYRERPLARVSCTELFGISAGVLHNDEGVIVQEYPAADVHSVQRAVHRLKQVVENTAELQQLTRELRNLSKPSESEEFVRVVERILMPLTNDCVLA